MRCRIYEAGVIYTSVMGGKYAGVDSYWLASPSAYKNAIRGGEEILRIQPSNLLLWSANYLCKTAGLRPVVCLRSDVSAEPDASGIWQFQS